MRNTNQALLLLVGVWTLTFLIHVLMGVPTIKSLKLTSWGTFFAAVAFAIGLMAFGKFVE